MKKNAIIAAALSTLAAGGIAQAQTSGNIATVESNPSGTAVTVNSDPIVTAVVSVPGVTVNGYAYSAKSGTFLIEDPSGGMEVYGTNVSGYTPTVGDSLTIAGTYAPFDQIPELSGGAALSISVISTGNTPPLPTPQTTTVSAVDVTTLPQSLTGQLLELDDVTITGQTAGETFGTADLTLTMTDSTGTEELFYYPHDFSVANANMFGETIPTGPVDIEGIAAVYPSTTTPEFYPIAIVPEPSSMALAALGGGAILMIVRRRK
jgi:hypothetical protein